MNTLEPLKPDAATIPEGSPEPDAAIGPVAIADVSAVADAEAGDAGSTTVQAPRTARGRGEPHRAGPAPRTPRTSPSAKAASQDGHSRPGQAASQKSAPVAEAPDAWRAPSVVTPHGEAGFPPARTPVTTGPAGRRLEAWMSSPAPEQPGGLNPGVLEPAPHDGPLEEEDSVLPPSRLSGLRNLLVSLGRRSLIEDEYGAGEAEAEPRFERAHVRQAYPEPPTAETEPAGTASVPVRLTAPPEFLPPRPAAEPEKEKEPVRPTPPVPRRERESPDEIQTLPSWRGQYRKKRYPPI